MSAGNAGTSNNSGGRDTKTPFGTASSTKTKDKFGYTKPKSTTSKIISGGGLILNTIKNNPISKKTEEVNRKFYNEKVVPAGKSKAPNYETYMKDRLAGKTDAYGNTTNNQNGGNNNNQTVETPLRAGIFPMPKIDGGEKAIILPTTSEDTIEKRKKKTKATGRSKSIMTSAKGVTKTSSDYSLGKPSLLGRV
jgi:hypothetical protein